MEKEPACLSKEKASWNINQDWVQDRKSTRRGVSKQKIEKIWNQEIQAEAETRHKWERQQTVFNSTFNPNKWEQSYEETVISSQPDADLTATQFHCCLSECTLFLINLIDFDIYWGMGLLGLLYPWSVFAVSLTLSWETCRTAQFVCL